MVNMRHVKIQSPTIEVGNEIIGLMCIETAKGILMQCGREHGFCEASDLLKGQQIFPCWQQMNVKAYQQTTFKQNETFLFSIKGPVRQQNIETLGLLANQ